MHPSTLRPENNEIVLRIYVNAEGSLADTPLVGDQEEMRVLAATRAFFHCYIHAFMFVLLVSVAAYHLLIFRDSISTTVSI